MSLVLFLVVVISLPLYFSMWSSGHCIDVSTLSSMLASLLPPSLFDTYSLSTSSFLFLAKSLMLSLYIKWLIYSCDVLSLYLAVHFLRMWLSNIMAITNCNGDSASPWNMPLWIFTSAKLCPPPVNSTLQVCRVFSINCMTWSGILYILRV